MRSLALADRDADVEPTKLGEPAREELSPAVAAAPKKVRRVVVTTYFVSEEGDGLLSVVAAVTSFLEDSDLSPLDDSDFSLLAEAESPFFGAAFAGCELEFFA